MGIVEELESMFFEELSTELDIKELEKAKKLISSELNSESFKSIFSKYEHLIQDKKTHFIAFGLLLGLGRNRIISSMTDYNVTRADVEKTQATLDLNNNERKKSNERIITKLKWETNSRIKRKNELSNAWEDIKREYLSGIPLENISKKHNVPVGLIKSQLEDEDLIETSRSTVLKKKLADNNESKIDDGFIISLLTNNPTTNITDLWKLAKKTYPWILRRQFYSKIDELNLSRSKYEVNLARSLRAKKNTSE